MRQSISSFVKFNGISIRVEAFLEAWASSGGRSLKPMPFKQGASQWNDGPTAMRPKKCVGIFDRHGDCGGVYEIWENRVGLTSVYFFETLEAYQQYQPDDRTPHAFAKEVGY